MKQQYDSYKPSGIDWIGDIPSHWKAMPLKRQGTMNTGLTFTKADLVECGDAVVSYGQIHSSKNDQVNLTEDLVRYIPKSISNVSALVPQGSFIFADTSEDLEGCGNAAYNNSDRVLYAGYHTIILRRKNIGGKYLAYLFQTDTWRSQIRSRVSGVKVYSVTQAILATTSIILPPLAEQEAIAAWLDEKCQEIDAAIAKVDREIELIDELKQSEISRVVTRGLNPDAPLRPSGIDWIGDIPSHWKCIKIKHLSPVLRGASPRPIDDPKYFDENGEFSWVRIADVTASERYLEITSQRLSTLGASLSVKRYPGDLFLSIAGTVGKPIITRIKCCIHDGFVWFPLLKINPEYLYYVFMTGQPYRGLGKFGTQLNLNTDTVGNIFIPLPPSSEIELIVRFLDKKCAEIDELKAKLTKKRETLTELRQSIISEVVTGKRKVI
ncbi:MAG: restriction endonuclease subunit S [Muribaculaceae bacterium]|nr:restriction endonuclease subunit S [Muribaculaceae bacterium]